MKFSELKTKRLDQHEKLTQIRRERAQESARKLLENQAKALTEYYIQSGVTVADLMNRAIEDMMDPKNTFLDTLRARGYRQAQINHIIHKLYIFVNKEDSASASHEEMLAVVSEYALTHEEVYDMLDDILAE